MSKNYELELYKLLINPEEDDIDISYVDEFGWGTVEQHGSCSRCGFIVEQAYSSTFCCFWDIEKGFKHPNGTYYAKNVKKHKRIRRKLGIKNTDYEINPEWLNYI